MLQIDFVDQEKRLSNVSMLILIITGIAGLFFYSTIASLIISFSTLSKLSEAEQNGIANFITYSFLFVSIASIVNIKILNFKKELSDWRNYLWGVVFAIAMIVIPILYNIFVNLFYTSKVSDNEQSLRSFITVYPVLSVIFLGFIGPICEEFTYRVSLFGIIRQFNKIIAYIVATAIFGLMHFNFRSTDMINELINLPVYLISGFLLTLAYDKFGLAASYTAHTINNLWAVLSVIVLYYSK